MNKIVISALMAFLLFLTGCTSSPVKTITKVQYVFITPETKYLELNEKPQPPKKKLYHDDQKPDFESLYIDVSTTLIQAYQSIDMCNNDKKAMLKDIEKKKQAYGR